MGNIDLNGSPTVQEEQKQKLIYFNIPTALVFINDCNEYPKAEKFINAMKQAILSSLTKKEIRQEILKIAGLKTVKKLRDLNRPVYDMFGKVFGTDIWGE